jgi:hypothetical protein
MQKSRSQVVVFFVVPRFILLNKYIIIERNLHSLRPPKSSIFIGNGNIIIGAEPAFIIPTPPLYMMDNLELTLLYALAKFLYL